MSEKNFSTNQEEDFNDEPKVTVKVNINEADAANVLALFEAPFPAMEDLDEIHLVIERKKVLDPVT